MVTLFLNGQQQQQQINNTSDVVTLFLNGQQQQQQITRGYLVSK